MLQTEICDLRLCDLRLSSKVTMTFINNNAAKAELRQFFLWVVHKTHPQSGRKGVCPLSSADIFPIRGEGVLQMRASAFFVQKTWFFEIYGVSAWTRQEGLSQCGHFSDKKWGRIQIFLRFCADVFYGRPLIVHTSKLNKQEKQLKNIKKY